jgi:ribosomal protein L37E
MKKMFCSECGKKHEFAHSPPNFCSACGSPLGSAARRTEASSKPAPVEDSVNLEDDETDIDEVPDIASIELEEEVRAGAKSSVTLGDIFQNPTPPDYVHNNKPKNLGDFIDGKE